MPWLETAPVDERIRFIQDALSDRFTMSELCARYGALALSLALRNRADPSGSEPSPPHFGVSRPRAIHKAAFMEARMRLLTPLCGVATALVGVGVPLRAQSADALYAGRSCNQDFAKLRAVAVSDVVDSGPLVVALREAADSASPITKVVLIYDAYGQLSKIKTSGTRSPAADTVLEREVHAMAKPVLGMPNDFMATIVRLNRRDVIDISPFPFTCNPREFSTPQAAQIMRESRRFPFPPPRDAVVQVWLRSSGDVADAWIVRSAGRRELDSLALRVVRVLRFTPPLVGTTPVATSLQVPVHF